MPDRHEHSLRVLGLEPGATEQAVKDAYRDLVKVWHPDRFGSDPRLRAKAQDKLKEINASFKELRDYSPGDFRSARESARAADRADRGNDFQGWQVREAPIEHAKTGLTRYVLMLVLAAAVAGFGATGLLMQRGREFWQPFFPAEQTRVPDRVQAPAPTSAIRTPPTPQTLKREAPPSDATRESAPLTTTGSLLVTSRPLGARVSLDGNAVGETPLTVTEVVPGEHRLDVSLEGNAYQPWSSSVVVTAGHEEKLLAVMTPIARKR
jgi:PEGA domain-containing protein/DnaJ-like protein